MPTLADIFREYLAEYLAQHPMTRRERRTIQALLDCRSGQLGSTLYQCTGCGRKHVVYRSCGNRHCPQCQQHKTRQWLEQQQARQLFVPYFLLTFTVPARLRPFLRAHKKAGYEALFRASSQAIRKLARDPRRLGSDLPGLTAVLHTWGRQLQYHPHLHYLVPGGGMSPDRKSWLPTSDQFFLPVEALSPIFRAKFRAEMKKAQLLDQIPAEVWQQDWVVHCQTAGDGVHALQYLARYVFRVAISNRRLLSCQKGVVTFSSELLTRRILTGDQFINKAQVGAGENRVGRVEVVTEFVYQMIRRGVGQMVKRNGEGTLFLVGKQIGLGGKNLT